MRCYKLSIRFMTYNHEAYIKAAMDGIYMQKTSFCFEVVVGDDFSSDKTLEIINSYPNTDKININVLNRKKQDNYHLNRIKYGRLYNFTDILDNCKGEYVAFLDGDDYWTDPNKLQRQVDFLDNNSDYSIAAHHTENKFDDKVAAKTDVLTGKDCPEVFHLKDALYGTPVHISSWVVRNYFLTDKNINKLLVQFPAADDPLLLYFLLKGKGYNFKETMGVYRITNNSVWNPRPDWEKHVTMLSYLYRIQWIIGDLYAKEIITRIINTKNKLFKSLKSDHISLRTFYLKATSLQIPLVNRLKLIYSYLKNA